MAIIAPRTRGWPRLVPPGAVCFCRPTQQGLLRLLTTAAVLAPYGNAPLSNREAWEVVAQYRRDDRITFAEEPPGLEAVWKDFGSQETASPKLWMDAYLAAFARCSGLQMITTDKAFAQFRGLDVQVIGEDKG